MNNGIYESRMEIQQLKEKIQRYEKAIISAYKLASEEGYCGVCDELVEVINAYNIDVGEEKG